MVIKERRTKILLALLVCSDVNLQPILFDQRIQAIFDLSFNQKTRGTISAMIKDGAIEKSSSQNENDSEASNRSDEQVITGMYRLTDKGFHILCLEFPFFRFLRDKWDGKWRILSYEIPESKRDLRDKLRREVTGWGLGPWHRSFWVTPHPIIENLRVLVSNKEEEQYIQAFEADHIFGDKEILIEKVWQKNELDRRYRELFKLWHEILSKDGDKLLKLRQVISEYVTLLRIDPGLPVDLVGTSWIGFEAFNIYKEIRSILLS
ncbi:MAG: PaaX family transcriptional regulator C-terminal domain-containing protein [Candidatus Roizmanbacteria bacterium]